MPNAERSLQLKALLFLYSNANIVGLGLALLGPVMLFAGFINHGWLLLTMGLYMLGWFMTQVFQPSLLLTGEISESLSLEETEQRLNAIINAAKPHLDERMMGYLMHIVASIKEILPRLKLIAVDDNAYTVRETALRYLPETLSGYMSLPPLYRNTVGLPGAGGKTAKDVLTDQLALLDSKMSEIMVNISEADAQAFIANGNFLKQKFIKNDFLV